MSKNFWIFGDSWGVPNYERPMANYRAKNHISELLADDGHRVENFSQGGASNYHSISSAKKFPSHSYFFKPDCIIYFHTSMIRDANDAVHNADWANDIVLPEYTNQRAHTLAQFVYKDLQAIVSQYNAELIVIEGHGCVVEPEFSNIVKPDLLIENWRGKVLGDPELPSSIWVSQTAQLEEETNLSAAEIKNELIKLIDIDTAMHNSDIFVDNVHPGDQAHTQLYNYLKSEGKL